MIVGICFAVVSMIQLFKVQTVYAYMAEMSVIGACVSCALVFWQSLLQSYTPDYITGRVFSISSLIGNISLPIAYGIFGVLLNVSSISKIMAGCGTCLIVFCCYLIFREGNIRASNEIL